MISIGGVLSGPEKGVITKGVFSLEESLESLNSLNSLESLENGRSLLYFPQSGGSLKSLESLNSLESLENDFSEKTPFPKDPFFRTRYWGRSKRGPENGAFGKPCFCPARKRGGFDENGENDESAF